MPKYEAKDGNTVHVTLDLNTVFPDRLALMSSAPLAHARAQLTASKKFP